MSQLDAPAADVFVESVRFQTADGLTLAGELAYPAEDAVAGVAWIANPHPFMGGRIDNNVIRTLAAALPRAGWASLRFDYRGVGNSEGGGHIDLAANMSAFLECGHAPDDMEKLADVVAADDFCRRELAGLPRVGIGYSFGAFLLSERLRDLAQCRRGGELNGSDLSAAVAICPTLTSHCFTGLAESPHRRMLICCRDDFATPAESSRAFIARAGDLAVRWFDGADHFFKKRETELAAVVADFLAFNPKGSATSQDVD